MTMQASDAVGRVAGRLAGRFQFNREDADNIAREAIDAMPETAALIAAIEAKDEALRYVRLQIVLPGCVVGTPTEAVAKIDAALAAPAQTGEG